MLLLLSHFSSVRLCAIPQTAAHQAPPSLGFSRQEHWKCCHFFLQCMKVKSESEVAQSCPTLRDPMDCSPPGSSVHGIFQARVLEWGAIVFLYNYIQIVIFVYNIYIYTIYICIFIYIQIYTIYTIYKQLSIQCSPPLSLFFTHTHTHTQRFINIQSKEFRLHSEKYYAIF